MPDLAFPAERTAWFADARFGLFLHWGLYSVLGRGEWALNRERIPLEAYEPLAERFTAEGFAPSAWCALAREAGMRYAVLTAKHHEGFCLWESRACPFNAARSAARRDVVGEFVAAARAAGLRVGLYYSLGDWRNPDWIRAVRGDAAARERFVAWTHELVRELMTGYGRIDVLWYDLPQGMGADAWRSVELNARVRAWQPGILINNRAMTSEDFATPEQRVAAAPPGRLWESCMTLNGSWGHRPRDTRWKSPRAVAATLGAVARGGGNLLLNVGPDAAGRLPGEACAVLRAVGGWLARNGEAVLDVRRSDLPWSNWCGYTVGDRRLYLHFGLWPGDEFVLGGLVTPVRRAVLLADGRELAVRRDGARVILSGLGDEDPDPVLGVVRLDLDGEPHLDVSEVIAGADVFPAYPP